ncbi:unnamed protein product, partial [Hymenolepis diminuta]
RTSSLATPGETNFVTSGVFKSALSGTSTSDASRTTFTNYMTAASGNFNSKTLGNSTYTTLRNSIFRNTKPSTPEVYIYHNNYQLRLFFPRNLRIVHQKSISINSESSIATSRSSNYPLQDLNHREFQIPGIHLRKLLNILLQDAEIRELQDPVLHKHRKHQLIHLRDFQRPSRTPTPEPPSPMASSA